MGVFKRKQEMNQAALTQLKRIADSLECSKQENEDITNKELITQLNRIAEIVSKKESTIGSEEFQNLALQLGRIVDVLSSPKNEVSGDVKKEQIIQLDRIANALELALPKEQQYSDIDKTKAAYALNLCLVSISQIIDYSDQYILEQEYDGILNNLNLEHMPKDEALLDILRQILDTITFFRIQEGEKEVIEREYQDRMKAAIWSAVPSCGAILVCPDPKAMLLTLLTQVGSGYMNYRNEKAMAGREKEKAMWELHKSAIEQFNGLRRELFTTAWKLADTYGFRDEMRLTENQIAQYNRILQEGNPYRRLARLEDIESKFEAFPPFWYSKGNTALQLLETDPDDTTMRLKAKSAYAKYFEINNDESALLRSDPIFSACALEYVSLMESGEKEKKTYYIDLAKAYAGTHFDILQLCAMAFLDIDEIEKAIEILKALVCEGYNESINAQLLSMLYIKGALDCDNRMDCAQAYQQLTKVTQAKLVEWPNGATLDEQYAQFVTDSRISLLGQYASFYGSYYSQKARLFPKVLLAEEETRESAFVSFAREIEYEINEFPGINVSGSNFSELLFEHDATIREILKKPNKGSNQAFDDIFKDVFIKSAENIAEIPLMTMEDITKLNKDLEIAVNSYWIKKEEQNIQEPENTLESLYSRNTDVSETFNQIKKIVPVQKILKDKPKHTQLLFAGSMEYYRYIRDHHLEGEGVIAIINDKSLNDCDLLISENGLSVHHGQSKTIKSVRRFVTSTGGVVPLLIGEGINFAYEACRDSVPYSHVTYSARKLTNPKYSNKYVDMDVLCNFIDECKTILQDGVAYQISKRILELSDEQSKNAK